MIFQLATNENDVIFDPFMGSGTTGVVATELNRKFIGIELNPNNFNLAKNRFWVIHEGDGIYYGLAKYKDKIIYEKQTRYQKIVVTQWKNDYCQGKAGSSISDHHRAAGSEEDVPAVKKRQPI